MKTDDLDDMIATEEYLNDDGGAGEPSEVVAPCDCSTCRFFYRLGR